MKIISARFDMAKRVLTNLSQGENSCEKHGNMPAATKACSVVLVVRRGKTQGHFIISTSTSDVHYTYILQYVWSTKTFQLTDTVFLYDHVPLSAPPMSLPCKVSKGIDIAIKRILAREEWVL